MKTIAYYHIYLPDDNSWSYVFVDQMREIIESGLNDKLDKLNVYAIGKPDSIKHLIGLLEYYNYVVGIEIELKYSEKKSSDSALLSLDAAKNENIVTETETLEWLWKDAHASEEPSRILYMHSKGITSVERLLNLKQYPKFINTFHWRKFMESAVIERHEECFKALAEGDTISTNYDEWPCPHYSGNFWWANSDYIKTLESPKDNVWWESYKQKYPDLNTLPDRIVAEMWIGSGQAPRMHSFHIDPLRPPISNMSERLVLKNGYYK